MVSDTQPTAASVVVEQYETIMATQVGVHVAVEPDGEPAARTAIRSCLNWMKDVERVLTRFDASSELSRLNTAGGQWWQASELLFCAVEQSIAAATATDGLFDPTILPVLEALGYDRDFALLRSGASRPTVRAALTHAAAGDWRGIELDAARRRIRLPHGTRLDLGGIAKGWAADVALDRFFNDVPNVLINVGGDMRVRGGPQAGEAWPIGIGASTTTEAQLDQMPVIALARGGLATSGAGDRWWYRAGQRQHHLIDPRTLRPAHVWIDLADEREDNPRLIAAAAALADTAAHAEIAAKVAILRGYPTALHCVEEAWSMWTESSAGPHRDAICGDAYRDAPVALVLMLGSGDVMCSANLHAYLETQGGGGNAWLT